MRSRGDKKLTFPLGGSLKTLHLYTLLSLALTACSSSDSMDTDNNNNTGNDAVPVLPSTNDPQTENPPSDNPPVESSPIDLLLQEIKQTAALPVLDINRKISMGQTLTQQEQSCIGNFEMSVGQQLKSVSCDTPWVYNDSILFVNSVSFTEDSACDQSISLGDVDNCALITTDLGYNLEWVVTELEPGPNAPIGNLQPIAGTVISYNENSSGTVTLSEASPITGSFNCVIELDSAQILSDQSNGNCQREIGRTLSRLYELRSIAAGS